MPLHNNAIILMNLWVYLSAALALPEHKGGAGDGAFSDGAG